MNYQSIYLQSHLKSSIVSEIVYANWKSRNMGTSHKLKYQMNFPEAALSADFSM